MCGVYGVYGEATFPETKNNSVCMNINWLGVMYICLLIGWGLKIARLSQELGNKVLFIPCQAI